MPETVLNWNDFPVAPAPFSCVKDLWRWPRAGRHIGILVGNGLPGAGRMAFWGVFGSQFGHVTLRYGDGWLHRVWRPKQVVFTHSTEP